MWDLVAFKKYLRIFENSSLKVVSHFGTYLSGSYDVTLWEGNARSGAGVRMLVSKMCGAILEASREAQRRREKFPDCFGARGQTPKSGNVVRRPVLSCCA